MPVMLSEFRKRIDVLLGYVTMYKLVEIGLMAIAAMALPLMATGYLPYSPVGFLISIALLVGTAGGSNWLFGWLFGVKPQLDSGLITGLILALIFSPPTTFVEGVQLVLVAAIAMASKYIIAIRNKHIFNPAAFAAAVASIGGLAFATWWVASPALLPVTVIVAALVLHKTQKFTVAGTFLAAAFVMIVVQTILNGTFSPQTLGAILTSWPFVFFAGIMLVEPLTLPPTHRQQLIIAVVVGVLATLSVHYGSVSMTPALALVIGNAVAFYMGIRQAVRLRFVAKKRQSKDAYEFTFDAPKFHYQPGQYIELSLPHAKTDFRGTRRIFTIIGRPDDEQLSIATRFPERHSTFKDELLKLKPGKVLHGLRVAGDFVLSEDKSAPILCIAGGIGITPFVSFVMNSGDRDITILYSVNRVDDLAFVKEFDYYDAKVTVVTDDDGHLPSKDWKREKGRITPELLKRHITPETHVYVSGPPAMVTSVKDLARAAGAKFIHTDHFSGY